MAGTRAILAAIGRAVGRDAGTFRSLFGNNFFFFIGLLGYASAESHMEPKGSYPFLLLLLIVLLFPLSSDPLDKVPPSRLALWPLTMQQRWTIRAASLALSPVLWLAIALVLFKRIRPGIAMAFLTALIVVQAIAMAARGIVSRLPRWNALKYVPPLPGRLGGLVRNHLRQMLQVLDFYVAAILCLSACAYRVLASNPDREAFPVLALMVALAVSTYAQSLFGLDRASGAMSRYRLFPLRGWEILVSKDLAYLALLVLIVLPLDPLAGLSFGLFALAVGHHASVLERIPLRRWRFSSGRPFLGVVQCVGGFMLGISEHRDSSLFVLASFGIYLISLAFYSRKWEEITS